MPPRNPLSQLIEQWLPERDFAVLNHGFLPHGRDYQFTIQNVIGSRPGTYRLVFTHVPVADYKTAVSPQTWGASWEDVFLDWNLSNDLDGYIWGTNWSLAYPGLTPLVEDDDAVQWALAVGRPMHAVRLETDRFDLRLVFHDVLVERLSEDISLISQVIHPIK